MKGIRETTLAISVVLLLASEGRAQKGADAISGTDKEALVKALCERIENIYIFTESTSKVCGLLKTSLKHGVYDKIATRRDFANRLNDDIEGLTHDKHFGITYDPRQAKEMAAEAGKSTAFYTPRVVEESRHMNYGFKQVNILDGNVGYLDLREFFSLRWSAEPAVAAMNYLSNSDAVIIDLRYNGGGEDPTVTFLLSYFIDSRDTTITFSTSYTRFNDSYYQSVTWPHVPGATLYDKPLYVLTSKSTFSAAEAFAYRVQKLKRATLVGERTRGGANMVEAQEIFGQYLVYIPSTRTIVNTLAAADWEGIGVQPDIEAEAGQALYLAHEEALKNLLAGATSDTQRSYYQWSLDGVKARSRVGAVDSQLLQAYVGTYGDRVILFENGGLYFQRGGRAKLRMISLAEDLFAIDTLDYLRLRFIKEPDGSYRMEALYDDGRVVAVPRGSMAQPQ